MNSLNGYINKTVKSGASGCQVAIPDGKYVGDFYFITDSKNDVITCLCWNGIRWVHEKEVIPIEIDIKSVQNDPSPTESSVMLKVDIFENVQKCKKRRKSYKCEKNT